MYPVCMPVEESVGRSVVIDVERLAESSDGWRFLVRVAEGASQTQHEVTVTQADYERLTAQAVSPGDLMRRTFEFLLAREPKEAILRRFEFTVVSQYFPDFETELKRGLSDERPTG